METRPESTLIPLGMLSIVANSKADIDFIDNRIENLSDLELYTQVMDYDTIGFGGTIFEVDQAVNVSKLLRRHKNRFTIYGGANATVNYKQYEQYFNQITIGEADTYEFRHPEQLVRFDRVKDLDALKFPYRENISDYSRSEKWLTAPTDTVMSSRGCPYNCSFCSSKIIWNRKYTMRSAKNVIDEVRHLMSRHGTKSIYFREDNFTINKTRLKEFCNLMPIEWKCESRVDAINDETAGIMAGGGCNVVWFGIEHTNNRILKSISKGITHKQTLMALEACEKHDIRTIGSFIIGLPEETIWDMLISAIKTNRLKLDHVSLNRAYAFPRSDMYDEIIKHNLDAVNHNGIILPRTKHTSRQVVDIAYKFINKYFAVKEKINYI
jgi:radical SAM superfamily enzyme YgiQ (UPF0313 family)